MQDFAGTAGLRMSNILETVRWFLMTPDANGPIEKTLLLIYSMISQKITVITSTSKIYCLFAGNA